MNPAWERDGVQLYLGDCLEILPTLEAGSVDAVVTDPPWGINGGRGGDSRKYGNGDYSGEWTDDTNYAAELIVPAIQFCRVLARCVVLTCGKFSMWEYPKPDDVGCFWLPASQTHGPWGLNVFTPILYYGKDWRAGKGPWPSGKTMTDLPDRKIDHPCPKPLKSWSWLVAKASRDGEIVLDPFMGSGTTGVACVQTGRKFIGIEIEPRYFEIAVKRIEQAMLQMRMPL